MVYTKKFSALMVNLILSQRIMFVGLMYTVENTDAMTWMSISDYKRYHEIIVKSTILLTSVNPPLVVNKTFNIICVVKCLNLKICFKICMMTNDGCFIAHHSLRLVLKVLDMS